MQIKPPLNITITLIVNCSFQQNQENCPPNIAYVMNVPSENGIIFVWMGLLIKIEKWF